MHRVSIEYEYEYRDAEYEYESELRAGPQQGRERALSNYFLAVIPVVNSATSSPPLASTSHCAKI